MHLPFNDPFAASPSWQPALDDLVRSVGGTRDRKWTWTTTRIVPPTTRADTNGEVLK